MTLRKTTPPLFEVRSQAQGLIEGYASVFGGVDSYGDTIEPGAFGRSLIQHKSAGTNPVMLWSHRQDAPIGRWLDLQEDSRGLRVSGQLNLRTAAGQQAFEHLSSGDCNGLSIGFSVPPGGAERRGTLNLLREIDLAEISVVTVPADSGARIHAVKSDLQKPASLREYEAALEGLGYTRREARVLAKHGYAALAEEPDPSEEIAAAIKAATALFLKS